MTMIRSVRSLILVIIVVALALFGVSMRRRSRAYAVEAETHRMKFFVHQMNVKYVFSDPYDHNRGSPPTPYQIEASRILQKFADQERTLYEKYRRAARYPWLPLPPDTTARRGVDDVVQRGHRSVTGPRSVRGLMIVVAITAFGVSMLKRHRSFADEAEKHRILFLQHHGNVRSSLGDNFNHRPGGPPTPYQIELSRTLQKLADHERSLYEKYRHAARYPWLSVAPDVPAP